MYSQIDNNKRNSFLLITFFIIFILFLGWIFGEITQLGYAGLTIAFFIALIMSLGGYFSGDKIALVSAGAKKITKEQNPYVVRMVENLAITAGIPQPQVYIIDDPAPNAFATGRNPKNASIALTTGLVQKLENEELEGVIAHELSHVKNYDIRFMTLVLVLVGIVSLLSHWFIRISFFGGRGKDNKSSVTSILLIAGLILLILSPLVAQLIKLAISRKREFLADADGALLTRYPAGLANALEKISQYEKPLARANGASAHLYIASPFGKSKQFMAKIFSTHPPIQQRIKALRQM
jgi:heat shock protein HtpX